MKELLNSATDLFATLPKNLQTALGKTQLRESSSGARSIIRSLEELGVDTIFGLPGGAILPTYDPLLHSSKLRHILVRHEQGAGHAAEGYAVATGKVGVCLVTSGPGATNLVTTLLDAKLDSVPLVVITGQVGADVIGTDAFQEADIVGASLPFTKHSFLVTEAKDIPARLAEAFYIAQSGRPGPVLVDITKSAQIQQADFVWPPKLDLPGYKVPNGIDKSAVQMAAEFISQAQRPVFYVGGGLVRAQASAEFNNLVELTNIPVVTTLNARGIFPDAHPNCLGMPGMHGTVPAVTALQKADLVIALGTRFDDRVTGKVSSFAPEAKIIHIDIDASEISKIKFAHVPIVGNLATVIPELYKALKSLYQSADMPDLRSWWKFLNRLITTYPVSFELPADNALSPQYVLERLGKIVSDAIFTTGVGQHQMWAQQQIQHNFPQQFITSCGAGTMGFGVPAAMGAKVGNPDKTVWCLDGDGSFQMTNQELATCRINDIPIKVALINNSALGMVRQWQNLFYGKRFSHTDLHTGIGSVGIPDFVKLAEAYDCAAMRVQKIADVDKAIAWAMQINDRPVVIDFVVSPDAMIWPMVNPGVTNDEIYYARNIRPDFGDELE